jgi:hypothetical protein
MCENAGDRANPVTSNMEQEQAARPNRRERIHGMSMALLHSLGDSIELSWQGNLLFRYVYAPRTTRSLQSSPARIWPSATAW